jgi:hypothetical protein
MDTRCLYLRVELIDLCPQVTKFVDTKEVMVRWPVTFLRSPSQSSSHELTCEEEAVPGSLVSIQIAILL